MFVVVCQEGGSVRVGDRLLHAVRIATPGSVIVRVDGEDDDIVVSWDRQIELFPGVQVTMERSLGNSTRIKFLFNAPREVKVREVRDDAAK